MLTELLVESAKRRRAQLAPSVDCLLLADLLDLLSGAILPAADLNDDQAREVLAMMWSGPR